MDSLRNNPAAELPPLRGGRDDRLDFWRGLCLIDMVLVHLAFADVQFGRWLMPALTDYLRFAAGGFVFLSGLCIGRIFLPKVLRAVEKSGSGLAIYKRIWQRSVKILFVQYVSTLAFLLLEVFRGEAAKGVAWHVVRDVLLCRRGNDLLLLYVVMLAATPLVLELMRRGRWPIVVTVSVALFAYGTRHPWKVALIRYGEFPPLLWQAVFTGGLLFGPCLAAFDALSRRRRWAILGGVFVVFAVAFQSAHAAQLFGMRPLLRIHFWKIPLSFGEMLRYLSLTLVVVLSTDMVWGWLRWRTTTAFICLLGRNSLLVYVAHLFVQEGVTAIAYRTWQAGAWQGLYGIAMLLILAGIAWGAEAWGRLHAKPRRAPDAVAMSQSPAAQPASFVHF